MALGFSLALLLQLILLEAAAAAPQDGQPGYAPRRIPILYEAYYPETREWSPQASLQEIARLRQLTSQLLKEEEQLSQLAAAAAEQNPENVFEPRSQILEYVFSRPAASPIQQQQPINNEEEEEEEVQVTSITVSDSGPQQQQQQQQAQHKIRHHHGQADWLRRRLAASVRR